MGEEHLPPPDEAELDLVTGDLPYRLQRWVGLIPPRGLGVVRRAVLLALFTWLPMAIWALIARRALPGNVGEPLLEHLGVHVRCLVAIPLFVLTEATSHGVATQFVRRLLAGGFVTESDMPRFQALIDKTVRLRNTSLTWVIVVGLVIGWLTVGPAAQQIHEVVWAMGAQSGEATLGFGGWWFLYVVRPIFLVFILGFLLRLGLWFIFLARLSRLDLALVPTHPDGAMGLGYLARTPSAYTPFLVGISSVVCAVQAHQILYHGADPRSFAAPLAAFVVVMFGLMVAPLLAMAGPLNRAKRQALATYGALVARHGRGVYERWILGRQPDDPALLEAPEIGPVADTIQLYAAVKSTRPIPMNRTTVMLILLPLLLPMLALAAIKVPLKELLLVVVKTLI
jgi:hypothetical protein